MLELLSYLRKVNYINLWFTFCQLLYPGQQNAKKITYT